MSLEINSEETLRNNKIFQRIIFVKFGVLAFSENLPLLKNTIFLPSRILRYFRQLNHYTFKPIELCGTHGWAGSWNSSIHCLVQKTHFWGFVKVRYLFSHLLLAVCNAVSIYLFLTSYPLPDFFTATLSQVQNKPAQTHMTNKQMQPFGERIKKDKN